MPNLVIRVTPPQQGGKAPKTEEFIQRIKACEEFGNAWHDSDADVDGCDLDCLAVVVGECLLEKLSPSSESSHIRIGYSHDCYLCDEARLHMTYPRNNVARFAVVKMLTDQSSALYFLTRDELDVPYTTRLLLRDADYVIDGLTFYNEFWTFPLLDVPLSAPELHFDAALVQYQQVRYNIAKFCHDYQKTRSGDGNRGAHKRSAATSREAAEEEQDSTTKSPANATINDKDKDSAPLAVAQPATTGFAIATGTDQSRYAGSGARDAGVDGEADQVLVGSAAEQRAVARPYGVDAATNTEERSAVETFGMVWTVFHFLYYGMSGCLWAIVAQGRKLWCFPFRPVVVRNGQYQGQAAPVRKRDWVFRKRDQRFAAKEF